MSVVILIMTTDIAGRKSGTVTGMSGTHPVPTGTPLTDEQVASLSSKQRMVIATAKLLQRQGYHATGLKQVVEEAQAPRGSIYHHFPGGKDELAVQALGVAAVELTRTIERARRDTDTPSALVRRLAASLATWLERSDYLEGCPVSTVTLEVAPLDGPLTDACRDAYAEWQGLVARDLVEHGVDPARAATLGTTVVAAIEGALLLCRAARDTAPLRTVAEQLAELLDG